MAVDRKFHQQPVQYKYGVDRPRIRPCTLHPDSVRLTAESFLERHFGVWLAVEVFRQEILCLLVLGMGATRRSRYALVSTARIVSWTPALVRKCIQLSRRAHRPQSPESTLALGRHRSQHPRVRPRPPSPVHGHGRDRHRRPARDLAPASTFGLRSWARKPY